MAFCAYLGEICVIPHFVLVQGILQLPVSFPDTTTFPTLVNESMYNLTGSGSSVNLCENCTIQKAFARCLLYTPYLLCFDYPMREYSVK